MSEKKELRVIDLDAWLAGEKRDELLDDLYYEALGHEQGQEIFEALIAELVAARKRIKALEEALTATLDWLDGEGSLPVAEFRALAEPKATNQEPRQG